jgi:pyrimidine-specific ribonucleoside hydrolase
VKKQVIIDCDPGIDDALALMLAFTSDELDVRAVTTLAGNVSAAHTARNALGLCELAGRKDMEVAAGAEKPLSGPVHEASNVHGENGLGNVDLPVSGKLSERHAVELLYEELKAAAGSLELIAIGPLTNIALLLERHPDALPLIRRLSIMGGALVGGNVTPHAEFNFYADPEAADRVFRSGIPIDMYGLDVTNEALLHPEEVDALGASPSPALKKIVEMVRFYQAFYMGVKGKKGIKLHDPLAVAGCFREDLTRMKSYALGVECDDPETRGKVVVLDDPQAPATVRVALEHDQDAFVGLFMERLKTLD